METVGFPWILESDREGRVEGVAQHPSLSSAVSWPNGGSKPESSYLWTLILLARTRLYRDLVKTYHSRLILP